jgi:hypothetical protein
LGLVGGLALALFYTPLGIPIHRAAYALVPAIAFLATLPFYVAGVLSTTLWVCLAKVLLVPTALGLVWLGSVLTAVQHLVPASMRATASALFLFINNLLGIGLGTTAIGALTDALRVRAETESLRYSILAGAGFYLAASVSFLFWRTPALPGPGFTRFGGRLTHFLGHSSGIMPMVIHFHIFYKVVEILHNKFAHFRHKVGVKSTKMVNTSNRPSSMAAEHTQVWKPVKTP